MKVLARISDRRKFTWFGILGRPLVQGENGNTKDKKDWGYSTCFVASPSQPLELLNGLSEAIATANTRSEFEFKLWTKNDIAGRALVAPIHDSIRNSALFAADVTYLNLNVTYEVGYAIGQSKRVLLTRYRSMKGDIELAKDIGIFDTLGRHEYDRFDQLAEFSH